MEKKIFYRVGNTETEQGLWYDSEGNFTGLIHNKFDFCTNHKLEMPYDPTVCGWLSATDVLETLFFWFTKEDIAKLEKFGYRIGVYEAAEYREHENHWLIKQDSSKLLANLPIESIG